MTREAQRGYRKSACRRCSGNPGLPSFIPRSACGYERLFRASSDHDRFGALSRHLNPNVRFSLDCVCFTPGSGRNKQPSRTSGFDPYRKSPSMILPRMRH